jgi:hypothetical protein
MFSSPDVDHTFPAGTAETPFPPDVFSLGSLPLTEEKQGIPHATSKIIVACELQQIVFSGTNLPLLGAYRAGACMSYMTFV